MANDLLQKKLDDHVVIFDGAVGTEFYKRNFFVNTSYEGLNLTAPKVVTEVHQSYVKAGAEVLTANTYGANRKKLARYGLAEQTREINAAGIRLAKAAAEQGEHILVAGSIGPVGIEVVGNGAISHEEAVAVLGEQICAIQDAGADFLIFETLSSRAETRCAGEAAKKYANIPVVFSFAVNRELETRLGEQLGTLLTMIEESGVQPVALGLNCDIGPEPMLEAVEKLVPLSKLPLIIQPNAGMPKQVDNRMIYMCSPEYLTTYAIRYVNLGVRGVGGCCGIGPEHIREMARSVQPLAKTVTKPAIEVAVVVDELQEPVPLRNKSRLAAKLANGEFITTVEITPPRGYDLTATIEKAVICRNAGIDAINIPDGPRASSRISPIVTANEIQTRAGIEVVLHCCCRDKNLIGMQADLLGCAWQKINNILFITGDPPKLGDFPFASGVFDVDSIGILKVASKLNRGVDVGGKSIGAPTSMLCGAGADPNALDWDRELSRLRDKIAAGAEFIITQPAFAVEPIMKLIEAISDLKTPVIAGIWPLASYRNAEFMKNEVPGVVVPDEIMARMAAYESRDDQRKVGIEIAREAVEKLRSVLAGVQVSAPFGNVNSAIAVVK